MIAIFEAVRTFDVIIAMMLIIRNLSWVGTLAGAYVAEGPDGIAREWGIPRTFPQGIVRLGTGTLCLMTLAAFLLPTINRHVSWLESGDHPALATVAVTCLAVLLCWRWMHFAKQAPQAVGSLVFAGALAIVAQFAQ